MTRSQAFSLLAAILLGGYVGWRNEQQVEARALDRLRGHFGDFEPVGVTADPGW